MADAISHLIKNTNLAKSITVNARKKVEDFDWKIVKTKWIEILK